MPAKGCKDYKDYPETYFKVVENFKEFGEDVVIKATYSEVAYVRHDLHRFFKALAYAAKEESDRYAGELTNVVRDMILTLDPPHAKRGDAAKLIVKVNPMTKMLLRHNPPS